MCAELGGRKEGGGCADHRTLISASDYHEPAQTHCNQRAQPTTHLAIGISIMTDRLHKHQRNPLR